MTVVPLFGCSLSQLADDVMTFQTVPLDILSNLGSFSDLDTADLSSLALCWLPHTANC